MIRPFTITYRRALDPSAIRVDAVFATPVSPDRQAVLLSPMADWAELGACGGLAGDRLAPPQSSVTLAASGATGLVSLFWVFSGVRIDLRALFTLENVLHFIHSTMSPLSSAVIQTGLLPDGYVAPDSFPPLHQPTPFVLQLDVAGRGMDLIAEFSQPGPEEGVAEQVMARVGSWFCAASVGAYGNQSIQPGQTRFYIGQEPTWDQGRLEFYLDVASGDQAAFDALVNVLHKAHHELARIESVSLES